MTIEQVQELFKKAVIEMNWLPPREQAEVLTQVLINAALHANDITLPIPGLPEFAEQITANYWKID
jgi:hypothetical protein